MEGNVVEMMEGGSGWAAEGQRRGSGGAAAHLPSFGGRRKVKLAEADLVREGKRVLGGVRGPKAVYASPGSGKVKQSRAGRG